MPKAPDNRIPYEEVVAGKIIEALKNGTAPWQKPWSGVELQKRVPRGYESGKPYNGMNFVHLTLVASENGYNDPRWLTFNQGGKLGASVRKGEKGTTVQFWQFSELVDKVDENGEKVLDEYGKVKKVSIPLDHPIVKYHTVFNAEQFNNLDLNIEPINIDNNLNFTPIKTAEDILQNSQANIRHIAGNKAYYSSRSDQITLPLKEQFQSEMSYYSTALHELSHWTGHESRLNRKLGNEFGSKDYAKEELKAEIGSFMICSKLGVDFDPEQHYAYVGSWIKALEEDPKEIFRAATDARKIMDYVVGLGKERLLEQAPTQEQSKEAPTPQKEIASEKTYLNVSIQEKDEAKALGARWDKDAKSWYAPEGANLEPLKKFMETTKAQAPTQEQSKEAPTPQKEIASEKTYLNVKTYLSVPFSQKDEAKALGARWDKDAKSWYAPEGTNRSKIKEWLIENQEIKISQDPAGELKAVLESKGLQIGDPIMDGKIHRVSMDDDKRGKHNGWYVAYQDGRPNALFGDYKKGQVDRNTGEKWIATGAEFSTSYDPAKAAELKALNEQKKQERETELKQDQLKTADILEQEFKVSKPADDNHPYLKAKNVKAYDLKVDKRGNLLIPLRDAEGKMWAVQRIGKPNEEGKTFKMIGVPRTKEEKANNIYHPAKKEENFFVIDPKKEFERISTFIIVEGYSTGATVHEATNIPVVVAIDSGNLQKVAVALQTKYPDKQMLIAGDNDLLKELESKDKVIQQENTGKVKAEAAASAVNGIAVIPSLTQSEFYGKVTDFNDLVASRGLSEVKKQLDIGLTQLKEKATLKKVEQQQSNEQRQDKDKKREIVRKQTHQKSIA